MRDTRKRLFRARGSSKNVKQISGLLFRNGETLQLTRMDHPHNRARKCANYRVDPSIYHLKEVLIGHTVGL